MEQKENVKSEEEIRFGKVNTYVTTPPTSDHDSVIYSLTVRPPSTGIIVFRNCSIMKNAVLCRTGNTSGK